MGIYTPDLDSDKPYVKPAEEAKVYDKERLFHLSVTSFNEGGSIDMNMELMNYRIKEDGTKEDAPEPQGGHNISNLMEFALLVQQQSDDSTFVVDLLKLMGDIESMAQRIKLRKSQLGIR